MQKQDAFTKSVLQLVLLFFCFAALPSVGTADEGSGSWLDVWRDAIGLEVSDPTPVFGDTAEDEKDAPGDKERPRKKFVSPRASDARVPGETEVVSDAASKDTGTVVSRLNPNAPPLNELISEWLRIAEPPINATDGARAYYDEFGRMLGKLVGAVARANGKPDGVGGRSSQEYVWSFRDKLDSVDHCTLEVYVTKKIANQPTNDCRGRYKPMVRNVVGMTKRNARIKLSGLGFNVIVLRKSATQSSMSEDDMLVESTSPPAGTTVERNSTVYVELRESAPDNSTKTASKPSADINPFAGADNSWIDTMRGREGKRSEKNARNAQGANASPGSKGSAGRTVFTSDDLLDDIEKMTGRRPDISGSVAVIQPGADTSSSTGGDASRGNEPQPTGTMGDANTSTDTGSTPPPTGTTGGANASTGSTPRPTGTTGDANASTGTGSTPRPTGTTGGANTSTAGGSTPQPTGTTGGANTSTGGGSTPQPTGTAGGANTSAGTGSGVSSGGGGPVALTAQSIRGPWNFAGSRRDGKSRSGSMTFNANLSYSFTIVDADGQSNGSGSGNWGLSGTRLSLDFPAPRSDWSGTVSGNSAAFTYTNNHGSYRYTRPQGWVASSRSTPSPQSNAFDPKQPDPGYPKWLLVNIQTNRANAKTRFSDGQSVNYYQVPAMMAKQQ